MCHLLQPAWANSAALLSPPIPHSAASSPKLPCFPLPPPLILHSLCKNVGYLGCGFSGILFSGLIFLGRHKLSQVQVIVLKYCTVTLQRRLSYIIVFLVMTSFLFQKKMLAKGFLRTSYIFPNTGELKSPGTYSQAFAHSGTPLTASMKLLLSFFQPTSRYKWLNSASVGLQQDNITVNALSKRYRGKNCITGREIN